MLKDDYKKIIASISAEIQQEIASENAPCDVPAMDEPDKVNWQFRVRALNRTNVSSVLNQDGIQGLKYNEIHYYRPLTSYYKPVQAIVIFAKRVIRKLVRFLGEPMVLEINQSRLYTASALETMQSEIVDLDQRLEKLQELNKQYNELQRQIESLRRENKQLRKKFLGASGINV